LSRPLRRLFTPTAFRVGLLAGVVTSAAAWATISTLISAQQAGYNVEVLSNGADVSRFGGHKVIVDNEQGVLLTETCNESCDDIGYRARSSGENSYGVRVIDAAGRNLLGPEFKPYVDSDTSTVMRWTLAGKDRLPPDAQMMVVRKDGSLRLFEDTAPKTRASSTPGPTKP